MTLSFLHTSDWHIGKRFQCPDAERLSGQRLEVIEKITEQAHKCEVDGILVCGDTFDSDDVQDRTLKQLVERIKVFKGMWFFLPGNHDALDSGTWERLQRYVPENVKIFWCSRPWVSPDGLFTLFPVPWSTKYSYENPMDQTLTSTTPDTLFRIGVAHGSTPMYQGRDDDARIEVGTWVEQLRLDYLALGHWHRVKEFSRECWYSGTPEVDRFPQRNEKVSPCSEPHKGQILHVHLTEPHKPVRVTPISVGRFGWMDLGSFTEYESLERSLKEIRDPQTTIVQVKLLFDQESIQRWLEIKNEYEDSLFWLRYTEESIKVDWKNYKFPEGSFLEEVAESLRTMMVSSGGEQSEVARQALTFLVKKYEESRED